MNDNCRPCSPGPVSVPGPVQSASQALIRSESSQRPYEMAAACARFTDEGPGAARSTSSELGLPRWQLVPQAPLLHRSSWVAPVPSQPPLSDSPGPGRGPSRRPCGLTEADLRAERACVAELGTAGLTAQSQPLLSSCLVPYLWMPVGRGRREKAASVESLSVEPSLCRGRGGVRQLRFQSACHRRAP